MTEKKPKPKKPEPKANRQAGAVLGLAMEAASMPIVRDRMTGVEAAAHVMFHLDRGEAMTSGLVSAMTGFSRSHACDLLNEMSRVVPLFREDGRWRLLEET